jgi:nucleotide-binding universal stress UspA family protein
MASEAGAGMIVVGSTHRGTLGRIATGTTADRVMDGAPCPVAVAPSGFRHAQGPGGSVGVAFVDTPGGWSALAAGAAIARRTGASLIAYTVTDASTHQGDRARAEAVVERAMSECADDLDGEARVLTGGAAALIEESRGLDFLVRGCRAGGALLRPLAKEVPSRLASGVECPLIIVGPGREQPLVSLFGAEAVDGREAALSA